MTTKTAVGDPPIFTGTPNYPTGIPTYQRYGDLSSNIGGNSFYIPIQAFEPFNDISDEVQSSNNKKLIESYIIINAAKIDQITGSGIFPKRFVIFLSNPDVVTITARAGDDLHTSTIRNCKMKFEDIVDGISLYLSGEGEWEAESAPVNENIKIITITLLNRNNQEAAKCHQ